MIDNYKPRILVVDDTPELLEITIRTLKKVNYQVFSAANGAECLHILQTEKPDLILLDVMLPDVNGKDLAKTIKSDPRYNSVYVILLSSLKTSSDHIAEGLEEGADGYIVRPVDKRELLARVASAFRIINAERESNVALFKYQTLFSSMEEGVYLHDIIYNEQGIAVDYRIIEANPASEKHLHIKSKNAVGKLATDLYKTKKAPFLKKYTKVAETGKAISFEQYFKPLNKYFHISVYSPEKGKFATAFSDITERKEVEHKLNLKNEELEKINAEKDRFFSIIAHDLKSPFNTIMGFSELLVNDAFNKNYEGIEKYAGLILKSSEHAMNLLVNLMEWAQSQTGRMNFKLENFALEKLINEIISQHEDTAIQKSIIIQNSVLKETEIYADKAMLSIIMRNLISNAIKFTEAGGKIEVQHRENQNENTISIRDTGIGISAEIIKNLFRIDKNITTQGTANEKGTGLGLILCKEFVEKHGGRIWLESKPKKGSVFYFTIPHISKMQPDKENK